MVLPIWIPSVIITGKMNKEIIIRYNKLNIAPITNTRKPAAITNDPKKASNIRMIRYGIKYLSDPVTEVKIFLLLPSGTIRM